MPNDIELEAQIRAGAASLDAPLPRAKPRFTSRRSHAKDTDPMSAGRPSLYSEEIAAKIEDLMVNRGWPLKSIAKSEGMPALATIYRWRWNNPEFDKRITRAREGLAEWYFSKINEIQEDLETLAENAELGDPVSIARVDVRLAVARQRTAALQWMAQKVGPKAYGDRKIISGDSDNPVQVETTRRFVLPDGLTEEQLDGIEAMLTHTVLAIEHKADDENS